MTGAAADRFEVLFSAAEIGARVEAIARELAALELERPLIVAVLTGSFVFAADLVRGLEAEGVSADVEFIRLSSYGAGTRSSGAVTVSCDIAREVTGRDVIVVDDILDSGRTALFAREHLMAKGARSVRLAVLIDKPARRAVPIEADHIGFRCGDVFVVGYGIDKGYRHRGLPFVGRVIEQG